MLQVGPLIKEEHIVELINRLRSGEYSKTVMKLKNNETGCHCAEGVLAEIFVEEGVLEEIKPLSPHVPYCGFLGNYKGDHFRVDTTLPNYFEISIGGFSMWKHNDGYNFGGRYIHPKTFDEIADLLEEGLKEPLEYL